MALGAGIASFAIAGIDIALWDLQGKQLGVRVLDLLGGAVRDNLPAIASLHATDKSLDKMAETIASHTATGLHGAKVGFGKAGEAHLGFDEARILPLLIKCWRRWARAKHSWLILGSRISGYCNRYTPCAWV